MFASGLNGVLLLFNMLVDSVFSLVIIHDVTGDVTLGMVLVAVFVFNILVGSFLRFASSATGLNPQTIRNLRADVGIHRAVAEAHGLPNMSPDELAFLEGQDKLWRS